MLATTHDMELPRLSDAFVCMVVVQKAVRKQARLCYPRTTWYIPTPRRTSRGLFVLDTTLIDHQSIARLCSLRPDFGCTCDILDVVPCSGFAVVTCRSLAVTDLRRVPADDSDLIALSRLWRLLAWGARWLCEHEEVRDCCYRRVHGH